MRNYLLFWDTKNINTVPDTIHFAEQELSQRAKELWKLYCIPADDPADFMLGDQIDAGIFSQQKWMVERKQVLKRISFEIGHTEEWRLLVFLMRDVDVLSNHFGLVEFLSALMDYDSSARNNTWPLEENFLTCPQPESIWLITLGNKSAHSPPSSPPSCRPDETRYSIYPPNCRFLRFMLDFHLQNSFSTKMLELHCGIRSLARDVLPAEVLRGNCIYQMEVDLDMARFHETVSEYDQWLSHVEQAIRDAEVRMPSEWLLPESAPTMNPISEYQTDLEKQIVPRHDMPEAQLLSLETLVDQELETDSIEEGRRLRDEADQLKRWGERQRWATMPKSVEEAWRKEMNALEKKMLQPHIKKDELESGRNSLVVTIGTLLFHFKGKLTEIHPFAAKRPVAANSDWQELKKEYIDYAQMVNEMKTNYIRKVVRASIPTLSGYLLFFYVMSTLGIPVEMRNMLHLFLATLAFTALIYLINICYYSYRRNRAYHVITKRQTARIMNSRAYFNNMGEYFRHNWVLMFHERMKQKIEVKRSLLLRQKKELDHFKAICGLMKLCCVGPHGIGQVSGRPGRIAGMLENDQRLELFQMLGSRPILALHGNHVTAAFPFIKALRLTRLVL